MDSITGDARVFKGIYKGFLRYVFVQAQDQVFCLSPVRYAFIEPVAANLGRQPEANLVKNSVDDAARNHRP